MTQSGIQRLPNMELIQTNIFDNREIELTLRYNFNTAKSKYKGTGAGNSEKERL